MERRIARRYVTDISINIWIPGQGTLGRAKTAEVPVADLSMFGASVVAKKSDRLGRGKVVQVTINDETTSAIVRSEQPAEDSKRIRYGLEFVQPSDEFLEHVNSITDDAKRNLGEDVLEEQLWLRSS